MNAASNNSGEPLQRSALSLVDDMGAVFFTADRAFRDIPADRVEPAEALLASGLLEDLAQRGWIVPTSRSQHPITNSALTLEQPRLPVVTYPFEWSYGMARDAAALVLDINAVAGQRGWELKDCHGYNIVFDGPHPRFVDVGSFARRPPRGGWLAEDEFLRAWEYPLRIWSHGGGYIAQRLMAASQHMSHADYGLYRWSVLRLAGAAAYEKLQRARLLWRRVARVDAEKLRARAPRPVASVLLWLRDRGWLPFQRTNLVRLRSRTVARQRHGGTGFWRNYQGAGLASVQTPRFNRICALLRELAPASSLEIGGNQGWLSERLWREQIVPRVTCTDFDESAVDLAYARAKSTGVPLHTAVLDFVLPMATPFGLPPAARLQSDVVLALAVSHHVLLTQRIPLARMMAALAAYARRFVFVEFMPLGLWDGHRAPPVPAWYTREAFRAAFREQCELLGEEELEHNRILFYGAVRRDAGAPAR